jgi:hypothetical protein
LHEIRALPQRALAQAHANELAVAEADAALRGGNADVALTALGCGVEPHEIWRYKAALTVDSEVPLLAQLQAALAAQAKPRS